MAESCTQKYENFTYEAGYLYCNSTWDDLLCWPPTKAGENSTQHCPSDIPTFNKTRLTYRTCSLEGKWEGRFPNESHPRGYTHYLLCLNHHYRMLMDSINQGGQAEIKFEIAKNTRLLEFVGLTVSLFCLLVSLFIFCYFRGLRNNRTRIHKNLFIAMIIQVLVRLILYTDQAITKEFHTTYTGIYNTAYLCEAWYVLLEYARTAMFMWMFIEGLYLHNMLTVTVFQANAHHGLYSFIGWGVPVFMTASWAITMAVRYYEKCWIGYNLTWYYWILEGPRFGVIVLNLLFLTNILRILIIKLRESHTSELEQIKTALRAAGLLLPLLGIVNIIHMMDSNVGREPWKFALWSYSTHFLASFQGFFIALLYCFLNGEVRAAIRASSLMTDAFVKYQSCHQSRRKSFSDTHTTEA